MPDRGWYHERGQKRSGTLKHEKRDSKDRERRSIPVHVVFWVVVLFLLYLFYRAFAAHCGVEVPRMDVDFAFGKEGLRLSLPEGPRYELLEGRNALPLLDPVAAIEQALDAPIGCPPLLELARGKRTAAISVCDITRPAPNRGDSAPAIGAFA